MGNLRKIVAWVLVFAMVLSAVPKLSAAADVAVKRPDGGIFGDIIDKQLFLCFGEFFTGSGDRFCLLDGEFRFFLQCRSDSFYRGKFTGGEKFSPEQIELLRESDLIGF